MENCDERWETLRLKIPEFEELIQRMTTSEYGKSRGTQLEKMRTVLDLVKNKEQRLQSSQLAQCERIFEKFHVMCSADLKKQNMPVLPLETKRDSSPVCNNIDNNNHINNNNSLSYPNTNKVFEQSYRDQDYRVFNSDIVQNTNLNSDNLPSTTISPTNNNQLNMMPNNLDQDYRIQMDPRLMNNMRNHSSVGFDNNRVMPRKSRDPRLDDSKLFTRRESRMSFCQGESERPGYERPVTTNSFPFIPPPPPPSLYSPPPPPPPPPIEKPKIFQHKMEALKQPPLSADDINNLLQESNISSSVNKINFNFLSPAPTFNKPVEPPPPQERLAMKYKPLPRRDSISSFYKFQRSQSVDARRSSMHKATPTTYGEYKKARAIEMEAAKGKPLPRSYSNTNANVEKKETYNSPSLSNGGTANTDVASALPKLDMAPNKVIQKKLTNFKIPKIPSEKSDQVNKPVVEDWDSPSTSKTNEEEKAKEPVKEKSVEGKEKAKEPVKEVAHRNVPKRRESILDVDIFQSLKPYYKNYHKNKYTKIKSDKNNSNHKSENKSAAAEKSSSETNKVVHAPKAVEPTVGQDVELKLTATKLPETKVYERKITESKSSESKSTESKSTDSKSSESKSSESKPTESKSSESKSTESKSSESKSSESKSTESKLTKDKLAESKLTESKLTKDKLAESKLTESKPTETNKKELSKEHKMKVRDDKEKTHTSANEKTEDNDIKNGEVKIRRRRGRPSKVKPENPVASDEKDNHEVTEKEKSPQPTTAITDENLTAKIKEAFCKKIIVKDSDQAGKSDDDVKSKEKQSVSADKAEMEADTATSLQAGSSKQKMDTSEAGKERSANEEAAANVMNALEKKMDSAKVVSVLRQYLDCHTFKKITSELNIAELVEIESRMEEPADQTATTSNEASNSMADDAKVSPDGIHSKRKGKNELDRLYDDINRMYIRDDVMKANGTRRRRVELNENSLNSALLKRSVSESSSDISSPPKKTKKHIVRKMPPKIDIKTASGVNAVKKVRRRRGRKPFNKVKGGNKKVFAKEKTPVEETLPEEYLNVCDDEHTDAVVKNKLKRGRDAIADKSAGENQHKKKRNIFSSPTFESSDASEISVIGDSVNNVLDFLTSSHDESMITPEKEKEKESMADKLSRRFADTARRNLTQKMQNMASPENDNPSPPKFAFVSVSNIRQSTECSEDEWQDIDEIRGAGKKVSAIVKATKKVVARQLFNKRSSIENIPVIDVVDNNISIKVEKDLENVVVKVESIKVKEEIDNSPDVETPAPSKEEAQDAETLSVAMATQANNSEYVSIPAAPTAKERRPVLKLRRLSGDKLSANENDGSGVNLKPWLDGKKGPYKNKEFAEKMLHPDIIQLQYKCMGIMCSFGTKDIREILNHYGVHEKSAISNDTWLQCCYCEFEGMTKESLISHLNVDHGTSPYQCPYCFYRSMSETNLITHQNMFHYGKKHSYLVCLAKEQDPNKILNEIEKNRRIYVRPFVCTECNLDFYICDFFIEHMQKAHEQATHLACHICMREYPKDAMIQHYASHNMGVYECIHCSFGTNDLKVMESHLSMKHPTKMPHLAVRLYKQINLNFKEDKHSVNYTTVSVIRKDIAEGVKVLSADKLKAMNNPSGDNDSSAPKKFFRVLNAPTPLNIVDEQLVVRGHLMPAPTVSVAATPSSAIPSTSSLFANHCFVNNNIGNKFMNRQPLRDRSKSLAVERALPRANIESALNRGLSITKVGPAAATLKRPAKQMSPITFTITAPTVKNFAPIVTQINDPFGRPNSSGAASGESIRCTLTEKEQEEIDKIASELIQGCGVNSNALFRCGAPNCHKLMGDATSCEVHLLTTACSKRIHHQCFHCKFVCPTVKALISHLQTHGIPRFFCFFCCSKFALLSDVRKHMIEIHKVINTYYYPLNPDREDLGRDIFVTAPCNTEEMNKIKFYEKLVEVYKHQQRQLMYKEKTVYSPDEINILPVANIFPTLIKCSICSYSTKVRSNFTRHLNSHLNNTHDNSMSMHDPVNPVPCLENKDKHYDKMINLASSSQVVSPPAANSVQSPALNCPAYVSNLTRYKCMKCNYLNQNHSLLRMHLEVIHVDEKMTECPHCAAEIKGDKRNIDRFINHLRFHGNRILRCKKCDFYHFDETEVTKHISIKHLCAPVSLIEIVRDIDETEQSANLAQAPGLENRWKCNYCNFRTPNRNDVLKHVKDLHDFKSQFICNQCSYHSMKEELAIGHLLKHNNTTAVIKKTFSEVDDNAPLWSRNMLKKKNIRGIPIEEEEEEEVVPNSNTAANEFAESAASTSSLVITSAKSLNPLSATTSAVEPPLVQNKQIERMNLEKVRVKSSKSTSSYKIVWQRKVALKPKVALKAKVANQPFAFACYYCSASFKTVADVKSHWTDYHKVLEHTEELPVQRPRRFLFKVNKLCKCFFCNKVGSLQVLDVHIKKCHRDAKVANAFTDINNTYQCGFCGFKELPSKRNILLQHIDSEHKNVTPETHPFLTDEYIENILKINVTILKCMRCPFKCDIMPEMEQHYVLSHKDLNEVQYEETSMTMESVYKCFCDVEFNETAALAQHLRKEHEICLETDQKQDAAKSNDDRNRLSKLSILFSNGFTMSLTEMAKSQYHDLLDRLKTLQVSKLTEELIIINPLPKRQKLNLNTIFTDIPYQNKYMRISVTEASKIYNYDCKLVLQKCDDLANRYKR